MDQQQPPVNQDSAPISRRGLVRQIAMAGTVPAVIAVIAATTTGKVRAQASSSSYSYSTSNSSARQAS
jgi:hypothetical protein